MAAQGTAIISICHAKIVSICVVSAILKRVIESLTSFTCDRHSFSCLLNGTVSGGRGDRCDSRVNTPDILGLRSYAVMNLKARDRQLQSYHQEMSVRNVQKNKQKSKKLLNDEEEDEPDEVRLLVEIVSAIGALNRNKSSHNVIGFLKHFNTG